MDTNQERELTFGEELVGKSFNPSHLPQVDRLKEIFAEAADILEQENSKRNITQNSQRIYSHALMEILNAQMCAVKYITLK